MVRPGRRAACLGMNTRSRQFVTRQIRMSAGIILLAIWTCVRTVQAQEPPSVPPPDSSSVHPQLDQQGLAAPCVQPPPVVGWRDYQGPLAKAVGLLGRRLDRESVHAPHYKPGAKLCTLRLKDKFLLFAENMVDPVTFLSAGFNAGISQAENDDPSFGQGAAGYGRRYGVNLLGQASGDFFKDFAYPTIFLEDPRYYRQIHGSAGSRLLHALEHSVVAYREDGTRMFNFSEWLGTASTVALSNTYHPDNRRGFSPAAQRVGYSVASDAGFDVLREFWPEIAHKLKLPFRDQNAQ
jgi:hypothetical protein